MKVINYLSKFLKPSKPTSTKNRYYKISLFDEIAPTMNAPFILYYPAPPNGPINRRSGNIADHLEDTLSKTLSEFYPMAGRYIRNQSLIDCNDQGVLYVRSKATIRLNELLGLRSNGLDPSVLNNFLPCEIGKADEVDDPILSVKSTTFECRGFAIGMCISHRIADMGNVCNFIKSWAARSNGEHKHEKYSPVFNLTKDFPQRGLPELDFRIPRSSVGIDKKARKFLFKGEAISAMRKDVGFDENGSSRPSKVQLVVALLWKAFVRMDQVNNGQSKASFVMQPVNLRDKVVPQLRAHSFGNCFGLATSRLGPGEGERMDFQDFVKICRESVSKTVKDSVKLTDGDEGYKLLMDPCLESNRSIYDKDVNFYVFTSWCKFSYYEADFGCGKPIWASPGKLPSQNSAILMDDDDGDGIEAMVFLDEKCLKQIEQDSDIKAYAN